MWGYVRTCVLRAGPGDRQGGVGDGSGSWWGNGLMMCVAGEELASMECSLGRRVHHTNRCNGKELLGLTMEPVLNP